MKRTILISLMIVFGSLTNWPGPLESRQSDICESEQPDIAGADSIPGGLEGEEMVLSLEEVQTEASQGLDEFFAGSSAAETCGDRGIEQKEDGEENDARQETTRIKTKLRIIESILRNAAIEPYYVNGQIEGIRLNGLDEIAQAKALLLESGDIIRAVNGQALTGKIKAYVIFKRARKEPTMTVDLVRDGETKQLLFDFKGAV
jgi:hypothetical protein